jgi:hypothetical protein
MSWLQDRDREQAHSYRKAKATPTSQPHLLLTTQQDER